MTGGQKVYEMVYDVDKIDQWCFLTPFISLEPEITHLGLMVWERSRQIKESASSYSFEEQKWGFGVL